jgi:hypothetical protein
MRFSGRIMRIWEETLAQTITYAHHVQQMRIMGFFQLLNLKFPSNSSDPSNFDLSINPHQMRARNI